MDELLGTILGRLGIRLPGVGGVPEGQQIDPLKQAMLDKAAKEQQAKFPPVQKAMVGGIDAATDFAKGLNYFPTDEVPQDAGAAYKTGALAAALPLGMFSRVDKIAESLPERIHPNKLLTILRNRAAKEEVNWRGLDSFIAGKGEQQIPKAEITEHLAQHPLDVNVIRKEDTPAAFSGMGDTAPTQYDEYQMPGAKNYTEDLIQLANPPGTKMEWRHHIQMPGGELTDVVGGPEYGQKYATQFGGTVLKSEQVPMPSHLQTNTFHGHHWDDDNVLVHVRHNERKLPATPEQDLTGTISDLSPTQIGDKGRMIENIQSDWHQRGAHGGYSTDSINPQTLNDRSTEAFTKAQQELQEKLHQVAGAIGELHQDYIDNPEDIMRQEDHSYLTNRLAAEVDKNPNLASLQHELTQAQTNLHNAHDAMVRSSKAAVPDAPFKDTWAELGLKQQLLDIAHNHPDTKWIGVAPSNELRNRGEGISPEFQDKQVPNTLEKLLKPFGGQLETATLFHNPVRITPKTEVTSTPNMRNYHQWVNIHRSSALPGHDPDGYGEVVASTWPRKPIRSLAPRDNPDVLGRDLINQLHPSLKAPQPVQAPIVRLTPEMLEEIRKKGFPLLTALLAAQGMKPEASHDGNQ